MRQLAAAVLVCSCLSACANLISPAEYDAEVMRARTCSPGDACVVLLYPADCVCSWAVRANERARLEALGRKVTCGEAQASCPDFAPDPQCVEGICGGAQRDGGAAGPP